MNKLNPPLNFLPNIREEGYNKKKYNAFTLVELIVVITILAILGTIAFISLQGYSAQSRDAVRISDLSSIKTGLELYNLDAGKYPSPNDETVITYSGAVAWTQGTFGEQAKKNIDKLDKVPTDPLTDKKYVYSTNSTRYEFQLAGAMEGDEVSYSPRPWGEGLGVRGAEAASTKTAKLKITGNYNGKLLKVTTGSTDYVLALPSIMAMSGTTVETITANNYLAYNGYKNLPFQYDGAYKTDGETALSLVSTTNYVVFSGSLSTLSDTTSTGINARKVLIDKLQLAYSGTSITAIGEIAQILNTNTSDPTATEYVATNLVANNLGGSIIASTTNGSGSSTGSTSTGATVVYGNDANSVFLLNADFDSSANQNTGTFNGNTSISNSSKKLGKGSYSFDGNGDYISVPDSTDFEFGNGNFTVDFWVKLNSLTLTSNHYMLVTKHDKTNREWAVYMKDVPSMQLAFSYSEDGTTPIEFGSTWSPNINQRYHIAVVRQSSTDSRIYVDGVQLGSTYTTNYNIRSSTNTLKLGADTDGGTPRLYLNGYLDEVRISKGVARWTSNFSTSLPSTYTTDSYTKLLLHSEGNIGNGNNHDLTFNGNINSSSSIGKFDGSYNYDGSGDYTTIPNNSDFQLGSGDFTIDFWVNPSNFSSEQGIVNKEGEWWFSVNTDNKFHAWFTYGTPMWNVKLDSTHTFTANQWYHIAVVRNGSTMKLYVNGTEEASSAVSGGSVDYIGSCANKWSIGAGCNGVVFFTGKVDEFRVSKGIARRTSAFTPETSKYISQ